MPMPKVPGTNPSVPTGPTGILSSNRKKTQLGGSRSTPGGKGLVGSQMKTPIGRKIGRR